MLIMAPEHGKMSRRGSGRWRRAVRKHRAALVIVGLYLVVFFFPTLFMGRVVSPNDVYHHYDPWTEAQFVAQNPGIHDPPLAYMPIAAMMKRAPESFHWNPWIAAGIPGWGSGASAILTPFVLIPALLPLALFYTAIILLKFLFAYFMSYLWLREERLGKSRAAIGALVGAAAGPMFVLWLWQSTNAIVLYPAMLYAMARMFNGKRNSVVLLTLMGICFLLSGYPASIVFALWLALFYGVVQLVRVRRLPWKELGRAAIAVVLSLVITAPVVDPFVSFLERSGYLEWRRDMSTYSFPAKHLVGLVDAGHLGNPAEGLWHGDTTLGPLDNYVELTIWMGPIVLLLALLSLLDRRARGRVLAWFAFGILVVFIMTGSLRAGWVLDLPGLRYSPTTRLRVFLPWVFAFLAASGVRGLSSGMIRTGAKRLVLPIVLTVAAILAIDYARIAATFYPYLPVDETAVESAPSIEMLKVTGSPFRVAPTFYWMMPNSSQIFGVEDIRSQWSSESAYREILRRIDPQAGTRGTVLLLNALTMNVEDPFLKLLNVRYLVEPPSIDILQWKIEERLEKGITPDGTINIRPGGSITHHVGISNRDAKTIEMTAGPADRNDLRGRLTVLVRRPETGETAAEVVKTAAALDRRRKLHVPITEFLAGEVAELVISADGGAFAVSATGSEPFVRVSGSSLALVHEGRDARIYELVDTLPRYRATWDIVRNSTQEVLADPSFDFARRTLVEEASPALIERLGSVPTGERRVRFRLTKYDPVQQIIETDSKVPFLFTASEKLTPELRVYVDGREVRPLMINGIFVGIPLEAGSHTILFDRRIGRDWWLLPLIGLVALAGVGIVDRRW